MPTFGLKRTGGVAVIGLFLVFAGFGCQKTPVVVDQSEFAQRQPFEAREGVGLALSLDEKDLQKAEETSRVLVAANEMGVAFSYDPSLYTVGSVGFDSNPNDEQVLQVEGQFLAVMRAETLGEGEEQPYVFVAKNLFLNGGSYDRVESSLGGEFESVTPKIIDGIEGREYRVTGEMGVYYVFPFKGDVAIELYLPDETNPEAMEILKSVRLAQVTQ